MERTDGIFEDLLNIEVNTIVKHSMTAEKMPPLPFALLDIISDYGNALAELRVEIKPYFEKSRAQCWTQCPDAAIPGLVSDPEEVLATAVAIASDREPVERLRPILKPLGRELRRLSVVTDRVTALLVAITSEYYLFAALAPGALQGRARFAMRVAGQGLASINDRSAKPGANAAICR